MELTIKWQWHGRLLSEKYSQRQGCFLFAIFFPELNFTEEYLCTSFLHITTICIIGTLYIYIYRVNTAKSEIRKGKTVKRKIDLLVYLILSKVDLIFFSTGDLILTCQAIPWRGKKNSNSK